MINASSKRNEVRKNQRAVILSFHMESSATLWNRVFEGFSSEMILVCRFEGKTSKAVEILYRFGSMTARRYDKCSVEPKVYGMVIKKDVSNESEEVINEWMDLMKSLRREIESFL